MTTKPLYQIVTSFKRILLDQEMNDLIDFICEMKLEKPFVYKMNGRIYLEFQQQGNYSIQSLLKRLHPLSKKLKVKIKVEEINKCD